MVIVAILGNTDVSNLAASVIFFFFSHFYKLVRILLLRQTSTLQTPPYHLFLVIYWDIYSLIDCWIGLSMEPFPTRTESWVLHQARWLLQGNQRPTANHETAQWQYSWLFQTKSPILQHGRGRWIFNVSNYTT